MPECWDYQETVKGGTIPVIAGYEFSQITFRLAHVLAHVMWNKQQQQR